MQICEDQKWREEKWGEVLAVVLRPLPDLIEKINIESRAMSEEYDKMGRLSMKVFGLGLVALLTFGQQSPRMLFSVLVIYNSRAIGVN